MKHIYTILLLPSFLFFNNSCNKYLDEKALKSSFIPEKLEEFQAILDNPNIFLNDPLLLELLSDDYYLTTAYWQNLAPNLSTNYLWASNAVPYNNSWNHVYQNPIYLSNIVLDYLSESELPIDEQYKNLKGAALFHRAISFYYLAQIFCLPYSKNNLEQPGIVLRTTTNINQKSIRATINETYNKIIDDLIEATKLLPISSRTPARPRKIAAWAALARVYLVMGEYDKAYYYSSLCIELQNQLIDFNDLIAGQPIPSFNKEVLFHGAVPLLPVLTPPNAKIDSNLLSLYDVNDLRRTIYFRPNTGQNKGTFSFRGSFNGTEGLAQIFTGATVGEMLLIKAECSARKGDIENSIKDLNILLARRINKISFVPIDPTTVVDPIKLVLNERRKELVFRGIRWGDLRRLNVTGENISIKRIINNIEYVLPANDKRWVALIPEEVINRSGIPQNPR